MLYYTTLCYAVVCTTPCLALSRVYYTALYYTILYYTILCTMPCLALHRVHHANAYHNPALRYRCAAWRSVILTLVQMLTQILTQILTLILILILILTLILVQQVRGLLALAKEVLLPIDVPNGTQPCSRFGVNPSLPTVQALYNAGEAAFLANIGGLVEPLTAADFADGSKRMPPSLFSHNDQVRVAHTVHAQSTEPKGVIGRWYNV